MKILYHEIIKERDGHAVLAGALIITSVSLADFGSVQTELKKSAEIRKNHNHLESREKGLE